VVRLVLAPRECAIPLRHGRRLPSQPTWLDTGPGCIFTRSGASDGSPGGC